MKNKIIYITLLVTLIVLISASVSLLLCCNEKQGDVASMYVDFGFVFQRLSGCDVDSNFINKYRNNPKLQFNERYVKINVTGFLKKTDYSNTYSATSVSKCKEFLQTNMAMLDSAEKKYNVPKEVITAILWIETKFGTVLGNNHLPSVFFSTALVNEEQFLDINLKVVSATDTTDSTKTELSEKVRKRSISKAKWALDELVSMAKIEKQYGISFDTISGSWAGAFGIPQFLPSSYLGYAVDGDGDGVVNLFNTTDAIHSVANYLAKHHWGNTEKKQRKAVYSYNNSNDYVDAVLLLTSKIK